MTRTDLGKLLGAGVVVLFMVGCGGGTSVGPDGGAPDAPPDPACEGVTCSGHGTCAAGVCECLAGYTGADCSACADGYVPEGDLCVWPQTPELIFFDDFEYVVDRDGGDCTAFQTEGGWSGVKAETCANPAGDGYIYTVPSIPGYTGAFPGTGSTRVVAIEARPDLMVGFRQTSFHLLYGHTPSSTNETLPGNVWFQFWMYINYYGDQLSQFAPGNKFIYPCSGDYPCHDLKWLLSLNTNSSQPDVQTLDVPTQGEIFFNNRAPANDPNYPIATVIQDPAYFPNIEGPWNYGKFGHTNLDDFAPMTPNRWMLVKMHMDTSTRSGAWEAWIRTPSSAWVKIAEWIDGVTPGLTWQIEPAYVGGHRGFAMPTTMGCYSSPDCPAFGSWIYLDDFAIATAESALPVYP